MVQSRVTIINLDYKKAYRYSAYSSMYYDFVFIKKTEEIIEKLYTMIRFFEK